MQGWESRLVRIYYSTYQSPSQLDGNSKKGFAGRFKTFLSYEFVAANYKSWIKNVDVYLHSQLGKAGIQLSFVICPQEVDPQIAPDEYTHSFTVGNVT